MNEQNENQTTGKEPEWGVVELMGHARMAGRISEETRFGVVLGRCDTPTNDEGGFVTRLFSGASIYRVTFCDEATARREAKLRSYGRYEMPALQAAQDEPDDNEYGLDRVKSWENTPESMAGAVDENEGDEFEPEEDR